MYATRCTATSMPNDVSARSLCQPPRGSMQLHESKSPTLPRCRSLAISSQLLTSPTCFLAPTHISAVQTARGLASRSMVSSNKASAASHHHLAHSRLASRVKHRRHCNSSILAIPLVDCSRRRPGILHNSSNSSKRCFNSRNSPTFSNRRLQDTSSLSNNCSHSRLVFLPVSRLSNSRMAYRRHLHSRSGHSRPA